ncbi:MAG: polyprenyl synthetase family protein [Candidatus Omnitrophota bacterium]
MKSKTIIASDRTRVNRALNGYLKELKGPRLLRSAMRYAVFSGGKRLRPILTLEACRASGGNIQDALPFACAIEFIHNFSLIHDDLPAMDDDDIRRGKPTCHRKFTEGVAILAGDELLNLAFRLTVRAKHKRAKEIAYLLSSATGAENMIGGQVLDLEYASMRKISPKLRQKIDRMKTAALMAISCKIGAIVAGARTSSANRIYKFGENLGIAFQLADDIRDAVSDSIKAEEMKKRVAHFIREALGNIKTFSRSADTLRYIADYVMERAENRQ